MPPHGHYGKTSNVRWVFDGPAPDEGHWQMRCPECDPTKGCWWDLTIEFWDPRTLLRCRACDRRRRRRSDRNRKAARAAYNRQYRKENRDWLLAKRRQRTADTPAGVPA